MIGLTGLFYNEPVIEDSPDEEPSLLIELFGVELVRIQGFDNRVSEQLLMFVTVDSSGSAVFNQTVSLFVHVETNEDIRFYAWIVLDGIV